MTQLMNEYQFGEAGRQMYDFFWSDFCDWYLEIAKVQMTGDATARATTAAILRAVLDRSLRLLHPFMPFVTEEVWQYLIGAGGIDGIETDRQAGGPSANGASHGEITMPRPALIAARWPEANPRQIDESALADFALLREMTTRMRDARSQLNIEQARRIPVIVVAGVKTKLFKAQTPLLTQLARTEEPQIVTKLAKKPDQAMSLLVQGVEIYLPLAGMIDLDKEIKRIDGEIAKVQADIERIEAKLANEQFVTRAKPEVVQAERDRLAAAREALAKLQARRRELAS